MMSKRFEMFNSFVVTFHRHSTYVREVLLVLFVLTVLGGFAISKIEGLSLEASMYFAFITGLTIGYGDITPTTTAGHLVSVGIGVVGMLFNGLVIAIASRTLREVAETYREHEQQ